MTAPEQWPDQPAHRDGIEPSYRGLAEGMTRGWITNITALGGGLLLVAGILSALTGDGPNGWLAALLGVVAFGLPILLLVKRPRRRVQWLVLAGCWLLIAAGVALLYTAD